MTLFFPSRLSSPSLVLLLSDLFLALPICLLHLTLHFPHLQLFIFLCVFIYLYTSPLPLFPLIFYSKWMPFFPTFLSFSPSLSLSVCLIPRRERPAVSLHSQTEIWWRGVGVVDVAIKLSEIIILPAITPGSSLHPAAIQLLKVIAGRSNLWTWDLVEFFLKAISFRGSVSIQRPVFIPALTNFRPWLKEWDRRLHLPACPAELGDPLEQAGGS